MRILVTGATGFVGRALLPVLREAGHTPRVAVRRQVAASESEAVTVGDVGPITDWRDALRGVDAVVHLAAHVHVMTGSQFDVREFERVNALGTERLARSAADAGVGRFVFVSSVKVNGEMTSSAPFRPDDCPNPQDPYGRSKFAAETALRALSGMEVVIVRPPLVHGPGVGGNLARLCALARGSIPVPFAAIRNRRDLVGLDNLVNLIERCTWHPAAAGQVLLVSDGEPVSTGALYRLICESLDQPVRMFRAPVSLLRAAGRALGRGAEIDRLTQSLELDITKTRELLDWRPTVPLSVGIAKMARAWIGAAT